MERIGGGGVVVWQQVSGDLEKEGRLVKADFQEPQVGGTDPSVHPQAGSGKKRMSITTEYEESMKTSITGQGQEKWWEKWNDHGLW